MVKNRFYYIAKIERGLYVVICSHDEGSNEASPKMTKKECEKYLKEVLKNA